jgi:predicted molibdopterin-dependent oxidoreductase YjgC
MRVQNHPILQFQHGKKVTFTFEGQQIEGYDNEPIAAALVASGLKVLSYSRRLKRPRGFFCAIGNCSSCLMRVNGIANVRTCITRLEEGMVIERQQEKGCQSERV